MWRVRVQDDPRPDTADSGGTMTPARDIVGDDKAEAAADHLATAFDAAQVADAVEIIEWLGHLDSTDITATVTVQSTSTSGFPAL